MPPSSATSVSHKGLSILTGICIFENERLPDSKKPYTKLYDVHFFVPGAPGEGLLAALRWYDNAESDLMSDLPGAFFVTAYVSKFSSNRRGLTLVSEKLEPKNYQLVGDIVSLLPVYNWEECVNPKVPPFLIASGVVENVDENDAEITYTMNLESYLQALDGNGTLPLSAKIDLQAPRWKPVPPDFKKRTPYIKASTYATVSGLLSGVTTELTTNEVVAFKISTSNAVPLGRASAAPAAAESDSKNGRSPSKQKSTDPNSPLKFSFTSMGSGVGGSPRKRRREDSDTLGSVAASSSTGSAASSSTLT
ncbi:hypothetical protein BJ165DRAFT_1406940 [Panaeolus papilionaceus]|nr:hypothetical protein BJ165DRAFT_1406940 [Panaeolus papilionaceus]